MAVSTRRGKGVGEVGSVVVVHGASGPWGQPREPMEMCVVRRIAGAPTGPVTTEMRRVFFSSLLLPLTAR
jgi:hypothetical protein